MRYEPHSPSSHGHVVVVLVVVRVGNVDVVVVVIVVIIVIVVVVLIVVDVVCRVDDGVDHGQDEGQVAEGRHLARGLARLARAVGQEHDRLLAPVWRQKVSLVKEMF